MSVFSRPCFWLYQILGLKRWGMAIIAYIFSNREACSFFKKSATPNKTLVLILPGVGGQYTQFYWMIRSITKHCRVDLLYIQPRWGKSLEENTAESLHELKMNNLLAYEKYIAIGHSRGGLLGKYILDELPQTSYRFLCTLATPWKETGSLQNAGLRGWIAHKKYHTQLSSLFRWSYEGTLQLFQTYSPPSYETCAVASLYDPIVGDPFYQCPQNLPDTCQRVTHLSIPLDKKVIDYIVTLINQNTRENHASSL